MKKLFCIIFALMFALCGCSGQSGASKTSPADAVKAFVAEEAFASMEEALNEDGIVAVLAESPYSIYIFKKDGACRYIVDSPYNQSDDETTYEVYKNGVLIEFSTSMFYEKTNDGCFVLNPDLQEDPDFASFIMWGSKGFILGTPDGDTLEDQSVLIDDNGIFKFTADKASNGTDEYDYTFDGQHLVMTGSDGETFLDAYILSDGNVYTARLTPLCDNFDYAGAGEYTVK